MNDSRLIKRSWDTRVKQGKMREIPKKTWYDETVSSVLRRTVHYVDERQNISKEKRKLSKVLRVLNGV